MTSQVNNNSNSTGSGQENKVVEYQNFFITEKHKKVTAKNLGEKTALLNSYFFEYLKGYNIPCAFVKKAEHKSLQLLNTSDFRFRVKILNAADGRTAKVFSIKHGSSLELPILEYHFGDSKESVITESHIISFNLCSYEDLKMINRLCSKINAIVKSFFERRNISLLELTCMFGKFDGKIYLMGDFSPVSIKVSDSKKEEKLPDPYKIETAAQMNKYSDYLLKLTSGD
jgi:phosphoribosylaminoimidazole-succinocarboxamide synthase